MSERQGMMGIIGCKLFEDEVVHLLLRDRDIGTLVVVENEDSKGVLRKVGQGPGFDIRTVSEEDLGSLEAPDGYSILLWMKPMALHQKPDKLNEDVSASIKRVEGSCKVILLFYGLCGNAFKRIDDLSERSSVPLVILKDAQGQVVDDCIGTVLGGTDEYYQELKRASGTFFLTPMWAENWREMFHKVQILPDPNDIEGARYVFECVGYKNVIKLDTGLGDREKFERDIDEFATLFNFKRGVLECTLRVVEASYDEAKELV